MSEFFKQVPQIIEAASKGPLSILVLVVLCLSVLSVFLFRRASSLAKIVVFVLLLLSASLLGYRLIDAPASPSADQPLRFATIREQQDLPEPFTQDKDSVLRYVGELFRRTQIIIDKGRNEGVEVGDMLIAIDSETPIKDGKGKVLGSKREEGSSLKVVTAEPDFGIGQLSGFSYDSYFRSLDKRMAAQGGTRDPAPAAALYSPFFIGQQVIVVSRAEQAAFEPVERAYGQSLERNLTADARGAYYREMIFYADQFLEKYQQGYHTPDALFQKGYAQFKLARFEESTETFKRFLARYPFHRSARGASDWIEQAEQQRVGAEEPRKAPE